MSSSRAEILFVSVHPPGRVPSQRFRFEQYVEFLRAEGFRTTFSPILRADEYRVFYSSGRHAPKALIAGRGLLQRVADVVRASRYDIVVVQREAVQLGTAAFERALSRRRPRLLFDFDDAIWLQNASAANERLAWLKRPEKTARILAAADMVFAGNAYLARYARRYNTNVQIIPTTIDTVSYRPSPKQFDDGSVCIGWSGSMTTIEHFKLVIPALRRLRERFGERVRFEVIGDERYRNEELGIRGRPWRAATEVQDLSQFDIGIMPLPGDEWAKGKCGLKALQYMALQIPPVLSPVGVNEEIVRHRDNGLFARTIDEWTGALTTLIESPALRRGLGEAARRTVETNYSVESQKSRYLQHLKELVG